MALFQSDLKETIKKLANKAYASQDERDELLGRVAGAEGVQARDVVWMLFRPDRAFRDTATTILQRLRSPETVDHFLTEAKGKPEVAMRAASSVLFALGIPGLEQRLGAFLVVPEKANAEAREIQQIARRVVAEAPPTKALEPILWQLESVVDFDERMRYIERLATLPLDAASLPRWQTLAQDKQDEVREAAVQFLAARAPEASLPLLVQQLPNVRYNVQQTIAEALGNVAQKRDVVPLILPLLATGDAGTRSAVLKILVRVPDRVDMIRRYINFSKTLAGFVRNRALDSLREFGPDLVEAVIDLLGDPDNDLRAAAIGLAASFDDKRLVAPLIPLLKDEDWWVRIAAADTLGHLRDPRATEALIGALADEEVRWTAVEALGRIGDIRALPALGKVLADPQPDVRIEVMQALRLFNHPQVLQALMSVATKDPDRNVRTRALEIVEELSAKTGAQADLDGLRTAALSMRASQGEPRLNALLIATRNQLASDFHLAIGQPPIIRSGQELVRAQGDAFTPDATESMLREVMTEQQWAHLKQHQQLDFCYYMPQAGRYRVNVFVDHRGYSAVFRVIPERPPTISDIGLPAHLADIADYHQGLVLICGPSGSGKSTTLAALVNLFNETKSHHVITMEDPIEFVHPFKNCLINQREVGTHTVSYARALRAALREDPDVIVIGELRDNDSIALALTAAETGHIVLGTLNSTSAAKAIDRMILSFSADEQPQIRASLSESLKYCVAQKLFPAKEGRRQVAAFEVLKGTINIANMIRDDKTFQIYSAMQIGRSQGMQTFDEALKDLVQRQLITPETAYMGAQKKEDFEALVSSEFLNSPEL
ncbi:MAG TPA: PilT/PilU family type 4a pilus ATPase [Thermoanaerobaculia bacterium]|nr:PilT/PilU family type 4a pilus ATPase [Thermoanaerobaculia bacterium]